MIVWLVVNNCLVYQAIGSPPPASKASIPRALWGNENVKYGFLGGHGRLLVKHYYVIMHNDKLRIPEWVTYHQDREDMQGQARRSTDFRLDPEIPIGKRAELGDYRRSGFQRGHMANAGDFKRNSVAISETFYLSNIAPQRPKFNQGIWERLVEQVRLLAINHGSIWIITGTLFMDGSGRKVAPSQYIGPNHVAVPIHFSKVILCEHPDNTREVFAFLLENRSTSLPGRPRDYMVSVRRIEELTGLDFFSRLPSSEEDSLETMVNKQWPTR
jgi:endonuclease G